MPITDLTTAYVAYLAALRVANPTRTDLTTLVVTDRAVVKAATANEDDENTMYARYLGVIT